MHQIGDIVVFNPTGFMGAKRKKPRGIKLNTPYLITDIRRGIDGAFDWDDLTLEGKDGVFCEFDFVKYTGSSRP